MFMVFEVHDARVFVYNKSMDSECVFYFILLYTYHEYINVRQRIESFLFFLYSKFQNSMVWFGEAKEEKFHNFILLYF